MAGDGAANSLHPRKPIGEAGDPMPDDLSAVVDAWPILTAEARAAILAVVDREAARGATVEPATGRRA